MRIGIGLWCLQSTATRPVAFGDIYGHLLDDARHAERVGLDSLWLSEHHFSYDGYCPALVTAAGAALAVTERLHVGTGVLLLPLQSPERVATAATDLAEWSGGRFELGMGMGYRPVEFAGKGLAMADRRARFEAGLETVRVRTSGVPMWVGVTSVVAARRAGRLGFGLFISGAFTKEVVDALIAAHRRAWEAEGGDRSAPPPVGLLRNIWLADDAVTRRRALDWVRSSYVVYAGLGWAAGDAGVDFDARIEASMDEVESSAMIGSAAEVAEGLATYDDVELVVCRIGYDAPPRGALTEVIERIGSELAPALRSR